MELRRFTALTVAFLATALLVTAVPTAAGAAPAPDDAAAVCANAQSPRNVDRQARPSPFQLSAHESFVGRVTADSVLYLPRAGGPPLTLYRCGQHYHFPIETPQGCPGEEADAGATDHDATPPPGSRVEIHTAYAANRTAPPNCDPETLECCTDPPFLVRGFSATVSAPGTDDDEALAIDTPGGFPLAEWSGSTTGPDRKPGECKPAATWSLRLGCDFTVAPAQLEGLGHAHAARQVQRGPRVSRDLTLVEP
jgi:hypothetical protein